MTQEIANDFLATINSYLGMLKHHKTYKIRMKMLREKVHNAFWNYFYISRNYTVIKKNYGNL